MKRLVFPRGAFLALLMLCVAAFAAQPNGWDAQRALDMALEDERHAIAFYTAVIEKHGARRPFSRIIEAERRHEAALLRQYERLGLTPPPNEWAERDIEVPKTIREASDRAVVWEIRNGRMYEELIGGAQDEEVRGVFERLRRASVERHLPAFQRHSSGWTAIDEDALSEQQTAQRERAMEARNAMFGRLMQELTGALGAGGPPAAIEVCSTRAPAIAEEVGSAHDVRIGRTSWKLRNPENTPPIWAELLVDQRPKQPRYMVDRFGRLGALTPIRLDAACLQCHGSEDQLAPGVIDELARLYPRDEATGFSEGELRGWFWVEVGGE